MRTFITILIAILGLNLQAQDVISERTAILMVHFGTTYDATRQKTIEAINEKARQTFKGLEVRDCYSSRIVTKRLKSRGITKDSPVEALFRLRADGFTKLIIQPTYIVDGVEMDLLRREVEQLRPFFSSISIGTPLLYDVEDAKRVADILVKRHPANKKKREHILLVGHGTPTPATALYSEIDYILKTSGNDNYHVATIEGYPAQEDAIRLIKGGKGRQVTLVPFLFVAGDHASNDISKDWKEALEQEGLQVKLQIEGLGEIPEIQDIYIEHIKKQTEAK
jgi:sirohydrochlorin cobaltochelatase